MIQTQVSACELCHKLDKSALTVTTPLQPVPFPDAPFHSKWPEVAFTSSVTTGVVIHFLNGVFTDNGPQLTSDAFTTFLQERGVTPVCKAVYHPAANGAIEHFNRILKDCVQSAIVQSKP